MYQYEKLESEKYFDFSLEVKEKRQRKLRSFAKTVWNMSAVMSVAMVAGFFFLENSSQEVSEAIYSLVSFKNS